jgi:hypothetical protein
MIVKFYIFNKIVMLIISLIIIFVATRSFFTELAVNVAN